LIYLKNEKEIRLMRESGKIAASVLNMIEPYVIPGVSTLDLDQHCHDFILAQEAIPAPLNYRGFPKSICTSVNEVVCHGIPNQNQILQDGDIINIDITTIWKGFHGDTSKTLLVGNNISKISKQITKCSKECLYLGIEQVKVGGHIGDIGAAIQQHAEKQGFSVVREFVGHGIGRHFHEKPEIYHYGQKNTGKKLLEGMTFTIEPMINVGHWRTKTLKDGWTVITADRCLSAQFEHTLAICSNGDVEILTED